MKKIFTAFILLSLIFPIQITNAQTSRFTAEKYLNGNGDTLNYRLLQPEKTLQQKYPLVIFLHGSGERGNDNEKQLKWGVLNFASDQMLIAHPAFVIAPQCPDKQTWSNLDRQIGFKAMKLMPQPAKPMEMLVDLIHQFVQKFPVDTTRIYITGLSMGGFGTYDALERYPSLFAAAVPVCGGGDTSKVSAFAHIPIWIFHGAEDKTVSPLCSKDMVEALVKAGARPGITFYPGVGHASWLGAYTDQTMMEWLFNQHK
jgi:predicted peptidase